MKHTIFIVLIFVSTILIGQKNNSNNDNRLAYEYFRAKDWSKAAVVYKRLYERYNSNSYFSYYIQCLTNLGEYDNVEKLLKKRLRKNSKELTNYVELYFLYKTLGDGKKATESLEKGINKLPPEKNQILHFANTLRMKREWKLAEQVYFHGREIMNNPLAFQQELANNYLAQRDYDKMLNTYFDMLERGSADKSLVQSRLQSAMRVDVDNSLANNIKKSLIRRIQSNPQLHDYSEMLIWLYLQNKEFEKALIQAKALDRKLNENGVRLMNIASMAKKNDEIDIAIETYEYVLEQKSAKQNHFLAKSGWLESKKLKIGKNPSSTREEYVSLISEYENFIQEHGKTHSTILQIKDYAVLEAFKLGKTQDALNILEEAIAIRSAKDEDIAECQLALADVYMLQGEVWEASLIYAKVEKQNKNNPIGHEAKFRKARLAYYVGDFLWAKAQLDVLKASTSKLIANDAFDLAMLINDNTALDTSETALQNFARAELYIYQNRDSIANATLDSILQDFPYHSLTDEIYFRKAEIACSKGDYELCSKYYQKVVDEYNYDLLGDDAIFRLADISYSHFKDEQKAISLYEKIITEHPNSIYLVEARKKFRQLRGDENFEEKAEKAENELIN